MYECAQSSITPNNLNLPVYDLHSREARDQILVNFHTLSQTASTISQRHMKKCSEQRQRIEAIRQRVLKCKERIQTLNGLNQAIVFVSPGQYPRKYEFDIEQTKSRFSDFLEHNQLHKMDMKAQYIVKHDINELGDEAKLKIKDLQQFVLFLFGRLKGKRKTVFEKGLTNKKQIESLGKIPTTIRYIDSLTVFNTHINPYRKYEMVNDLFQIESNRKQRDVPAPQANDAILHPITEYRKEGHEADITPYRKEQEDLVLPDFEADLQLEGVVGLDTAFNDDTTNFTNAKKKTVVKDTMAGKKDMTPQSSKTGSEITDSGYREQPQQKPTSQPPSKATNNLPPPPPPMSNSSSLPPPPPPPPSGLLPPPPPPPPPMNLSAPKLSMPPPPPPPPPPSMSSPVMSAPPPLSNNRSALLSQLNNSNPMARLKRTVTVEKGTVDSLKKAATSAPESSSASGGSSAPAAPGPMSFLDQIKEKVAKRFVALHPERESEDEDEDGY